MDPTILFDIGIIIIVAAIGAILSKFLRQPLILGYVLAGILIGPAVLGLIKSSELILTLSELGIAFLLFFIGLELDLSKLKRVGKTVTIVGIIQVILTTIVGFVVASFWLNPIQSLYVGLIVAFSSTMIVMKLISDNGEIDSLHGRIILGILLIQDLFVVVILPFLGTLNIPSASVILLTIVKILTLFLVAYLARKFIVARIMKFITTTPEVLFIASVGFCFVFLALSYFLSFSIAIGGFIAGIAIAKRPYNIEVAGRVRALKDFFAVMFFVTLGSQLSFFNLHYYIYLFIALLLLIFLVKPLIIFLSLKLFKYSNRISLITGSSLSQISEFSLILAAQGIILGHLNQEIFSLIIIISILTITVTGYIIKYNEGVFNVFSSILNPLDKNSSLLEKIPKSISNHVVLFGSDRMGSQIVEAYEKKKDKLLIVDFNPEIISKLIKKGYNCIYGDYANQEVLHAIHLNKAKRIISTIPSIDDNIFLLELIKGINKNCLVILKARTLNEALTLYEAGADFVVLPEVLAGQKVNEYMKKFDHNALKKRGEFYHKLLKERARNDLVE